jgi:hypothetical protein
MMAKRTQEAIEQEIAKGLNLLAEYEAMGVEFTRDHAGPSGKATCYSRARGRYSDANGGGDREPSAVVFIHNGRYFDSSNGESLSIWDFALRYSTSPSFSNWIDAREHFAKRAGVNLPRVGKGKSFAEKLDELHFLPWTPGNEKLTQLWGRFHKQGISLEAVKAAGGRIARWRCYYERDKKTKQPIGEKRMGRYAVVAIPAFSPKNFDEPRAWIIWNLSGPKLQVYQGEDVPPIEVKMYSVGDTRGLVVGKHGLQIMAAGGGGEKHDQPIELIWKTAGPTDMLALWSAIPVELRDRHLVVTNASTETGDISPAMAGLFGGHRLGVVHDADDAGVTGAAKWLKATVGVTAETRWVQLPYPVERKKGRDVRDFFSTDAQSVRHSYADLFAIFEATPPYVASPAAATSAGRGQGHAPAGEATAAQNGQAAKAGDAYDPAASPDASPPPSAVNPITNAEIEFDDEKARTVPLPMVEILDRIVKATDGWPCRMGEVLFIQDGEEISWLRTAPSVFGWLSSRCGVIDWKKVSGAASKEEVFQELRRTVRRYMAVETIPHEPPIAGHYYACGEKEGTDGSALWELLDRFCPQTEDDRMLILAMFATVFWGGSGGARPAFVLVSDSGRGAGKTKITDMVSRLAGGHVELSQHEDAAVMKQRLLSPEGISKRIARLDNVKSLKFSWSDLESMITAPMISGKVMYVGEGSRPNILTWLITFNAASFSTDLAQRSVIIKIAPPKRAGKWETETIHFINKNRERIVTDIIGFLRSEPKELPRYGRWAAWESDVLSKLPDPEAVQAVIAERSGDADTEAEEIEIIEHTFAEKLRELDIEPTTARIHIPSKIAARWFNDAMGEKRSTTGAGKVISQFIKERRARNLAINGSHKNGRGFIWVGDDCDERITKVEYDLEERIRSVKTSRSWR